ncbi:glycosyltransferase [Chelatococcus sp. GCM10030263]|uniref:glycosyltransferase n=1 Tax=Chelatococcus sp. GCM10030263 TaxID=3273387 RepID=UPI003622B3BE
MVTMTIAPTITIDRLNQLACFPPDLSLEQALADYVDAVTEANARRPVAEEVTAIVPVFNTDPAMLHVALDSLLGQKLLPAQVIVIDDGSSRPETLAYLAALRQSCLVQVLTNRDNLSLGPTMNRALRACPTPYALKLDADDVARPALLAAYAAFLDKGEAIDVLGSQFTAFGHDSYTTTHPSRITRSYILSSPGYWFVNHTGVLLNRDSVLKAGGYRALRGLAEDYDLWIRMMLKGFTHFANLPESLVDYRDSATALHRNFRRGHNRLRLMALKAAIRLAPAF